MSTRSRIGIENEDRTVTSVYCHHDGYPEGVGDVLTTHYTTTEKVKELIGLGDLSSVDENIEETAAYCRDRGEDFEQRTDINVPAFFNGPIEEYGYLFTQEGEWLILGSASSEIPMKVEDILPTKSQPEYNASSMEKAAFRVAGQYMDSNMDPLTALLYGEELSHVKMMIVSGLMTKYGFGYQGGGFIQSLVANDLYETLARADETNKKAIVLIVGAVYSISLGAIQEEAAKIMK